MGGRAHAGRASRAAAYQGSVLLAASIKRTQAAGQTVSCTILVNGRMFCQHNGIWTNCQFGHKPVDLVQYVCAQYAGASPPPACRRRA